MNHSLLILVVHALVHVYNVSCQQKLYVFNQVVFRDEASLNISNIEAVAADFEIKNQDEENSFFQYKYQVPILVVLIIIFIILLIVHCKVYCKKTTRKEQQNMEIYPLPSRNSGFKSSNENLESQEIQNQTSVNPDILEKSAIFLENEKSANFSSSLRMEDQKKLRNPPIYFKKSNSRNETIHIQVNTTNSFYI